jgi:hypothetical protein
VKSHFAIDNYQSSWQHPLIEIYFSKIQMKMRRRISSGDFQFLCCSLKEELWMKSNEAYRRKKDEKLLLSSISARCFFHKDCNKNLSLMRNLAQSERVRALPVRQKVSVIYAKKYIFFIAQKT